MRPRRIHLVRPLFYQVRIIKELCKGCQLCISACPRHLLTLSEEANERGYLVVEWENSKVMGCIGCGVCYHVCPEGAIRIYIEEER